MIEIQCPSSLMDANRLFRDTVFVAGGISNCGDWQRYMVSLLSTQDDGLALLNPRRTDFDITNPDESSFQIDWEHKHLHCADAVLFWFPHETLCPITLYELGVEAARGSTIFVGCDPKYARRFDVVKQLSLIRPMVEVRDSIEAVAEDVKRWYNLRKLGQKV